MSKRVYPYKENCVFVPIVHVCIQGRHSELYREHDIVTADHSRWWQRLPNLSSSVLKTRVGAQ